MKPIENTTTDIKTTEILSFGTMVVMFMLFVCSLFGVWGVVCLYSAVIKFGAVECLKSLILALGGV